jgi:hypothetical protein
MRVCATKSLFQFRALPEHREARAQDRVRGSVFFLHILGDFGAHNEGMDVKAKERHRATPLRYSASHINAECPALSAPDIQKEQIRLSNPHNVPIHLSASSSLFGMVLGVTLVPIGIFGTLFLICCSYDSI